MSKTKICFIAPKAYPVFNKNIKSTFGGAEVQLCLLSKEFAKMENFDVHFMVADYGQDCSEVYENVKVWKSLNFKSNIIRQMFVFLKIMRKINANIYIQRTLSPFSAFIALYCRIRRKKFVYMVSHDRETDGSHRLDKNFLLKILINMTYKLANLIVVQNEYQKNKLCRYKGLNIILVKSGYQIHDMSSIADKNGILWASRSAEWKRPGLFVELAKKLPDEKFVMICNPATNGKKLFEKMKEEAKSIKNLQFINHVPFQEIDEYFHKARLFISTSTQEGFPNTFIQATKNHTPIVSLNVNPDDFLDKHECGICCNNDFELMCNAVRKILSDNDLYEKFAKNAFCYSEKNHNIENTSKILLTEILKTK